MIRREVEMPDGTRHWWLISQIEHARISAELARAWGGDVVPSIVHTSEEDRQSPWWKVRNEVLTAFDHHDDGWKSWEANPTIDPQHQRPPSFTEMPLQDSLTIWRQSAELSTKIGPLAAWLVAGHFVELLSQSDSGKEPMAKEWLSDVAQRRAGWLESWLALDAKTHTDELAEQLLGWLQYFDVLSLWFCCGTTSDFRSSLPVGIASAAVKTIVFSQPGTTTWDQPTTVVAHPWPFVINQLVLQVSGSLVPVGEYSSGEQLAAAATSHQHRWRVVADETQEHETARGPGDSD